MIGSLIFQVAQLAAAVLLAELLLRRSFFERVGAWLFPARWLCFGLGTVGHVSIAVLSEHSPTTSGVTLARAAFSSAYLLWLTAVGFAPRDSAVRLPAVPGYGDDFGWLPLRGVWRHLGASVLTLSTYSCISLVISVALQASP